MESWKRVYELARNELNPANQLKLCEKARRLLQNRALELSASGAGQDEQKAIEEALRELWILEEKIRKPDIQ